LGKSFSGSIEDTKKAAEAARLAKEKAALKLK